MPCRIAAAQSPRLGVVAMENSGSATAQVPFLDGLAALHSFEYATAARAFREAQRRDPAFLLAYWGEAMTHTHPVWNQQAADSARAVLARFGATPDVRRSRARTPREADWLGTVEVLYGAGGKARRDTLYLRAMERLAAAYPDDVEAHAFLALAWLGLNQGVRSIPDYMQAGAIAQRVLAAHPRHPGAAHYVIHAFDDPTHAPLGLDAARAYSRIAPDAPHAQHMTTHIFLSLGLWEETLAQNIVAVGDQPWRPGHYTYWWHYALTQLGREREARVLRDSMRTLATPATRDYMRLVEARHALEFERWDDSAFVSAGGAPPGPVDTWWLTAQALAAARRGDQEAFTRHVADFERLVAADTEPAAQAQWALYRAELAAIRDAIGGRLDEASAQARLAAHIADTLPVEFGPPAVTLPPYELLGALLQAQGRAAEAQRAWQRALSLAPGRSRALVGLVRAARTAGDDAVADAALARLERNWRLADDAEALLTSLRRSPVRASPP